LLWVKNCPEILFIHIWLTIVILIVADDFLRARGFNIAAAKTQFTDAETWRKKNNVHKLYHGMSVEIIEHAKRFYPRWTGRRDKVRIVIVTRTWKKEVLTLQLVGPPTIRVPPRFLRSCPTRIRLHTVGNKVSAHVRLPQNLKSRAIY
jgi:hypothetical protein